MKGKLITFRPSADHRARLERLSEADEGRPLTFFIEKALEAHLPKLEAKYAQQLADLEKRKKKNNDDCGTASSRLH